MKLFLSILVMLAWLATDALAQGPSRIAVMANTNGNLLTPTNFFGSNVIAGTGILVEQGAGGKITITGTGTNAPVTNFPALYITNFIEGTNYIFRLATNVPDGILTWEWWTNLSSTISGGSGSAITNGRTLYVTPQATGNGSLGRPDAPYALTNALAAVSNGQTVILAPWIYTNAHSATNGSLSAPTFTLNQKTNVTIYGMGASIHSPTGKCVISIQNCSNIVLEGIEFTHEKTAANVQFMSNYVVLGHRWATLQVYDSAKVQFRNLTIRDAFQGGITADVYPGQTYSTNGCVVDNCTFVNCGLDTAVGELNYDAGGAAVRASGGWAIRDSTFERCSIGVRAYPVIGLTDSRTARTIGVDIYGCRFIDCNYAGVMPRYTAEGTRILNNTFLRATNLSIPFMLSRDDGNASIYCDEDGWPNSCQIQGNTISGGLYGIGDRVPSAPAADLYATNMTIVGNTIRHTRWDSMRTQGSFIGLNVNNNALHHPGYYGWLAVGNVFDSSFRDNRVTQFDAEKWGFGAIDFKLCDIASNVVIRGNLFEGSDTFVHAGIVLRDTNGGPVNCFNMVIGDNTYKQINNPEQWASSSNNVLRADTAYIWHTNRDNGDVMGWVLPHVDTTNGVVLYTNWVANTNWVLARIAEAPASSGGDVFTASNNVFTGRNTFTNTVSASNLWDRSNVKWWGATGDGVTDDTLAISNCVVANSALVYFPSGTYKITDSLNCTGEKNFLTIRGDGMGRSIIVGYSNSVPVFDFVGSAHAQLEDIQVISGAGSTPSCAFLIGRINDVGWYSGQNTFRRIAVDGTYTHAAIYGIASELNRFEFCDILSWSNAAAPHALVYLAKTTTNLFGDPITSPHQTLTSTGVGGNGFNTFIGCTWQYGGTGSTNGILFVQDYAQATALLEPYFYSDGCTNIISLGESTVGFSITGARMEFANQMPIGIHLRAGTHRDLSINGSAVLPMYAETGSTLAGFRMYSSHWAGTNISAIPVVDLFNATDIEIDISEATVPAGKWLTNGLYQVRGNAIRSVFGQTPTNRVSIATNTSERALFASVLDSYSDYMTVNAQYLSGPNTDGSAMWNFGTIAGRDANNTLHIAGSGALAGSLFMNYSGGSIGAFVGTPGTMTVNGSLGIGTNSPQAALHVVGNGSTTNLLSMGTTAADALVTVDTNGVLAARGIFVGGTNLHELAATGGTGGSATNAIAAVSINGTNLVASGATNLNLIQGPGATIIGTNDPAGTANIYISATGDASGTNSRQWGSAVLTNLAAAGITNWVGAGSVTLSTNAGAITFTAPVLTNANTAFALNLTALGNLTVWTDTFLRGLLYATNTIYTTNLAPITGNTVTVTGNLDVTGTNTVSQLVVGTLEVTTNAIFGTVVATNMTNTARIDFADGTTLRTAGIVTNKAHATTQIVSLADNAQVQITNAVSADTLVVVTNPVIGKGLVLFLTADGTARTISFNATPSMTWLSTNGTAAATNLYVPANKTAELAIRARQYGAGNATNLVLFGVVQP